MSLLRGWRFCSVAVLMLSFGPSAAAQDAPVLRPYRRIFGYAPQRPGPQSALELNATVGAVYDDNVLADHLPEGDPRYWQSGAYPAGAVDLEYNWHGKRASLRALGSTALQYYPQLDFADRSHNGAVDWSVPVGQQTQIHLTQTVSYASFYTLFGLPGGALAEQRTPPPGSELSNPSLPFSVSPAGGWQSHSAAMISQRMGRFASLEGRYAFSKTALTDVDSTFQEIGVRYTHQVSQDASLIAGYSRDQGRTQTSTAPLTFNNIDLGVNYQHRLSRMRNTTFSFSTGSAIVRGLTENEYRFLADARLIRIWRRTWTSSIGYHRGIEFLDVLSELLSADAVTGTLDGYVSPRIQVSGSGFYSHGLLGSTTGAPLTTYSAGGRMQYAVNRTFALTTEYFYYFHEFGQTPALPTLTQRMARQSVRVGLEIWMPLVR